MPFSLLCRLCPFKAPLAFPTPSWLGIFSPIFLFALDNYGIDVEKGVFMKDEIPELPNFIHLIRSYYQNDEWTSILRHWENLIFSLLAGALLFVLLRQAVKKKAMIPSGWQNCCEYAMEFFSQAIERILGDEGRKHIPFLATLFIYILTMNWFGIIPFMKSPTANLSITAALALCVFAYVQYLNIKHMGIFGFLYHLAGSPKNLLGWILVPLMLTMELIAQISRPVTLALRLAGNILGEHILMSVFALLGVVWIIIYPVTIPLQIPAVFLALFTGLLQALVFTMLSTVYIFLSIPHTVEHRQ
jgi:F-type H+-transporting ATPase subunit a